MDEQLEFEERSYVRGSISIYLRPHLRLNPPHTANAASRNVLLQLGKAFGNVETQTNIRASKSILSLNNIAEDQWRPIEDNHVTAEYVVSPGDSLVQHDEDVLTQLVRPREDVGRSTRYGGIERARLDQVANFIREEDYPASFRIARELASGAQAEVAFGLNEPCLNYFHEFVDSYVDA